MKNTATMWFMVGVLTLSLALLPTQSTLGQASAEDIDPEIKGEERQVMLQILAQSSPQVPRRSRNVIYVSLEGRVYVNRVALRGKYEFLEPVGGNAFVDSTGYIYFFPELQPKPGGVETLSVSPSCTGGTGPYRRVHSNPGMNTSLFLVTIPSKTGQRTPGLDWTNTGGPIQVDPTRETAHVMVGGWGNKGGAVDAGFFHNWANDNWALFIKSETMTQPVTYPTRFPSGTFWVLVFWVPSNDRVAVRATLIDPTCGCAVGPTYELQLDVARKWDWNQDGSGNVLKRTTSVAQNPQNLSSGAFLLNERWQGGGEAFSLGTSPTGWEFQDPGTECNWPDTVRVRKEPYVFTYTYSWGTVDFPGEWVSIDLR